MTLFWRVFLIDAAILVVAAAALLLGPVTVSTPVVLTEALILGAGLVLLLVANGALLRVGLAPVQRLTRAMSTVDLSHPQPLRRLPDDGSIAPLIHAFNAMQDRLGAAQSLRNAHILAAQEAERRRIAQELHDEVGQTLTAVLLELKAVADRLPEPSRGDLRAVQETARSGLDEIRRIARRLRPGQLEDLGLARAVMSLVDDAPSVAGLTVRTNVDADLPSLGPDAELVVYRVAQESLTNAVRHARARCVVIELRRTGDGVTLVVRDDGVGIAADARDGAGIQGMRERALLVGADLRIGRPPGGGTEVTLRVPRGLA